MGTKIDVDLNDLLDLVNYTQADEEDDFEENGGADHIVHAIRRLASRINGHRTTTNEESNRMTEREYFLYATRRCSHVVEYGTVMGSLVHCQEPVKRFRTGTFLERTSCPEHVRDTVEDYGHEAHH